MIDSSDTIANELCKALQEDDGVTDIVFDDGEGKGYARIFPQLRVQDHREQKEQVPAIIFDLSGQSEPRGGDCGKTLRRQARRLVCYARSYEELERLAKAVETALTCYVGPGVLEVIVASQDDDYEDEINIHERQIELSVLAWS